MPRDPTRIPMILAAVEREWRKQPDTRLGQLLVNLVPEQERPSALFAIQDGELLARLNPESEEEHRYIEREPAAQRAGWSEWSAAFRAWRSRGNDADQ